MADHGDRPELLQRAVRLGNREQQRDADEREKQRDREPGNDRVGFQTGGEHADDPRERQTEPADIDARRHRKRQRDDERDERQKSGAHEAVSVGGGSRCLCTLPIAVRGSAFTRINARGILNDARPFRHASSSAVVATVSSATM